MSLSYRLNPQLMQLTVQDWKKLCNELHLKVTGRKDEVQRRVLAYLHSEDGRKRAHGACSSELLKHIGQVLGLPLPKGVKAPIEQEGKRLLCLCNGAVRQGDVLQCTRCLAWQHKTCIGKCLLMTGYQCPGCQLQQIEPLDHILDTILDPTSCVPPGLGVARQFPYLTTAREKALPVREVQIRCIKVDEKGYLQRWPKEGSIIVNSKTVEEFVCPPKMTDCLGARKRVDRPFEVSTLIPGIQNSVAVVKRKESDLYAYGLFHVEKIPVETLIARLSTAEILSEEAGKEFVARRVNPDEEVYTANYCQVLRCPLTRLLPDVPVRGFRCQHIQCFDLMSFVVLQDVAQSNRWSCPVCRGPAFRVVVDRFIQKVVSEAKTVKNCYSVEFEVGARYRFIQEDIEEDTFNAEKMQKAELGDTPQKRAKCIIHRLKWPDFLSGRLTWHDITSSSAYLFATGWH